MIRRSFVGRNFELQFLRETFGRGESQISIIGNPGVGKTALALVYADLNADCYTGGVVHHHLGFDASVESVFADFNLSPPESLLILDQAENLSLEEANYLNSGVSRGASSDTLVVSRHDLPGGDPFPTLRLSGLEPESFWELIDQEFSEVSDRERQILINRLRGNPAILAAVGRSVREGLMSLRDVYQSLNGFHVPGLVGPDGRPVGESADLPAQISVDIKSTTRELIARLGANPTEMRMLPPRQFEELVADLLSLRGYSVELTPASGDGGIDIYAAKKDDVGEFLYLVECKRYNPPNKVGVNVVRSLHGVVQAEKASAGIVATTSFFTAPAETFRSKIRHQMQLSRTP